MKIPTVEEFKTENALRMNARKEAQKEAFAPGLTITERYDIFQDKKAAMKEDVKALRESNKQPKMSAEGTEIKKVLISAYGNESNVSVVTDVLPAPAKNEVQVKVLYSGFSGSDINMRLGQYPFQRPAPLTPGYCCVGPVVSLGPESSKFKLGDMVCCLSIYDSQATLVNLPEKYTVAVPEGVDVKAAPALLLDWNTAYGMVMHTAHVRAGQKVFVHGMSGAVGWAISVLSALQGAEVYGTAGPKNHEAVRKGLPGATPYDYSNKDWITAIKAIGGVNAVFDPLGFESWDESYSILSPKSSMLVGYGGNMSHFTGEKPRSMIPPVTKLYARNYLKVWEGRSTRFYYITRDDATFFPDLEALFDLAKTGKIQVPIKAIFGMHDSEEIRTAHRSWGKGQGVGSLLIKVADEQAIEVS
jgi:NADPH:quinone reductase-like Zn-dependent oxidoreductase